MACSRRSASASAVTQSSPSTSVSQRSMMRWRRTMAAPAASPRAVNSISLRALIRAILSHAAAPVDTSLAAVHRGDHAFVALVAIFAAGMGVGLLSLVYFNARLFGRTKNAAPPAPKTLAMMIATGLGLHNLSEGLAIGQSAATGAVAFAIVLVIGFALHNVTEGFGIAAPLATDSSMTSWSLLLVAGLIGGAPTFLGTVIGYLFTSTYIYVLFLALA